MATKRNSDAWIYILGALLGAALGIYFHKGHAAEPVERDYGRTCLALVEYLEARSDGAEGMREVGRVVLRRLVSHRFGETICDVANAAGQFEALTLVHTPRHPEREPIAWALAQRIAEDLLAERFDGPYDAGRCQGALFFSQTERPSALCKVGSHFFFQSNQ